MPWQCNACTMIMWLSYNKQKKGRSPQSIMVIATMVPQLGSSVLQLESWWFQLIPNRACRSSARPAFTAGVVPFRGTTATERKDQIIKASAMMLQPTARFLAKRLCWYAFSPAENGFIGEKRWNQNQGNPGVLLSDVVSCWLMLLDVDCWWEIGHPAKWQKQKARMKGHTHTPKETSNAHQQSTRQPSIIPTNRFNPPLCPTLSHASPGAMSSGWGGMGIQGRQTAVR